MGIAETHKDGPDVLEMAPAIAQSPHMVGARQPAREEVRAGNAKYIAKWEVPCERKEGRM